MFTDEHRCEVWDDIRQQDIRDFSKQLTPTVFAEAAKRTGVVLVKSPLYLVNLVWLGVSAAIHATDSFATVLTMTLRLLEDQQEFAQSKIGLAKKQGQRRRKQGRRKHDPRRNDPTAVTEEALTQARQRLPLAFGINLIIILGENFETQHPERHRFRGFRILAMDGTRLTVPNYQPLKRSTSGPRLLRVRPDRGFPASRMGAKIPNPFAKDSSAGFREIVSCHPATRLEAGCRTNAIACLIA